MACNERKTKCPLLFFFFEFYSLPPPADYPDSEDAIYLTTMDTPVVGIASACFKQYMATLVCLRSFLNTLPPARRGIKMNLPA